MASRVFTGLRRSVFKINFNPKLRILLFLLLGLGIFFLLKPKLAPGVRPNIVMINIDLFRSDHMSFYGYAKPTTPFLDSIFSEGTAFTQATAPAYLTYMTDMSILSSLYPSQNFFDANTYPSAKALATLPKILSYEGYRTAAYVSEFLPQQHMLNQLFDEYYVQKQVSTLFGDNLVGSRAGVIKFIAESKEPYYMLWNIDDLHTTYYRDTGPTFYDKAYRGPFADKKIVWEWVDQPNGAIKRTDTGQYVTITDEDREYLIGTYDTELNRIDQALKDFFEKIKTSPRFKNTIFVITSEHGEDLGEHGFFHHRDIYDVVTHVPLAIFGPGIQKRRVEDPVSLLDIMPTVLGLLSVPKPENIEGVDLGLAWRGTKQPTRDIYTERLPFGEYGVRQGRWKYILRNPDKSTGNYGKTFNDLIIGDNRVEDEFYDLDRDPLEQTNLIKEESAVKDSLKAKAIEFKIRMRAALDLNRSPSQKPEKFLTYP